MSELFTPDYAINERKVRVALAASCNLRCEYCDQGLKRTPDRLGAMEDFRSTPLSEGSIDQGEYMRILQTLKDAGYSGVTFTGGEPMLNPHWPELVRDAKEQGFSQVRLTTNGLMLETFLRKHHALPKELDLLTVSLDTFDDAEFHQITGGHVSKIIKGILLAKEANPLLPIKANKVVMRSNLNRLKEYVDLCEDIGVIDQLTLLNLICKDVGSDQEKEFFAAEYVPPEEVKELLPYLEFSLDAKHEFIARTQSGLTINLMDTDRTLRADPCTNCPIYCQEGFFTTRVATDGSIRTCADFSNKLGYVRSTELGDEELALAVKGIIEPTKKATLEHTMAKFCTKYSLDPLRMH